MPHSSHANGPSRFMRSRQTDDRRHYHRFETHGLVARIGGSQYDVHDVSVGGIRIQGLDAPQGARLTVLLLPSDGKQLDEAKAMAVEGLVVGHVKGSCRVRFPTMSYTLAKFLIHHLARQHGVEPYIFK